MPLNNDKLEDPLASISIDFLTLAFGPTHHAIRFKKNHGRSYLGLLQYNIQFEQVCDSEVFIRKLDMNLHNIESQAICTNFRLITPDSKLESSWSPSKIGEYHTKEHETLIKFNFLALKNSEPRLKFNVTMENLIDSSIQI